MKKSLTFLLVLLSNNIIADETYWELGAGVTTLTTALYPGSSENSSFIIPLPFLRIKSDNFEVDDGVRGFLFESPDYRLNISAGFGIPVDSEDSTAREGMPDLNTVLQLGPSLEIIFSGGRRKPHEFRLELPLRAAIATDISSTENVGWIFEPRLSYETLRPFKTGWAYQVRSGLRYAAKNYNAYYYDVPVEYATPQRSAYQADAGYGGAFLDLMGNWRQDDLIYFAFMRYQNLSGSTFVNSPLVEDTNYFSFGLGMMWIFTDSR
jgi:MipA family protein